MPLSPTEQNKVVQLLGYGGKTIQPGSVIFNKILNDRLNNLPTDTESIVRTYLTQVAAIETQMFAAPTRMIAKKVGDIELNNREIEDLRRERKRLGKEISVHLDVPYVAQGGPMVTCSV
jgi:hypothetical protein